MEIIPDIASARTWTQKKRNSGKTIGLVPTMGALHQGHLELVKSAHEKADVIIVSIFVNPAQFNNKTDFKNYPKSLESDIEKLSGICDMVFSPETDKMYPEDSKLTMDFGEITAHMEGKYRPGHFNGVALVVSKLFNIIKPDFAWFGQKDFQQFALIDRLNNELAFGIELIRAPIVRERDGLAMSSRNRRLNDSQRNTALLFYRALQEASEKLLKGTSVKIVKKDIAESFRKARDIRLEYFEIADTELLKPISDLKGYREAVLCIAGYVGDIRLIDNTLLTLDQNSE